MARRQFGERLVRLALICHPAPFRGRYGDELVAAYVDLSRDARSRHGRLGQIRYLFIALAASLREGLAQRRGAGALYVPLVLEHERKDHAAMRGFGTDVKHAMRRFTARPWTSGLAILMLALAVGVTTAMFTVVDALMLRPVPFKDPAGLTNLRLRTAGSGGFSIFGGVAPAVLAAWRDSQLFAMVEGAHTRTSIVARGGGAPLLEREVAFMTPGMLSMLGVAPARGRGFTEAEARESAGVALVSAAFWRSVLGGSDAALGTTIQIDGAPVTVIGVMPDGFKFPGWKTDIWRPIDYDVRPASQARNEPSAYVRFSSDVPEADALTQAAALARAAAPELPPVLAIRWDIAGVSSRSYLGQATPFLGGGVVLVCLILCANVATLLLAQLSGRAREFGMCAALGASRRRLLRQALTESALLGAAGVAVGVAAAWMLVSITRSWLPDAFLLQTLNPIDLDPRALAVAGLVGLGATIVAGVLPAWIGTRGASTQAARAESRSATESPMARRFTRALLVGEIALTCTLLVATALLVLSFTRLSHVDRGLDTSDIVTTWISAVRSPTTVESIEAAVRGLPGVGPIVISQSAPPDGSDIYFGDGWYPDLPGSPNVSLNAQSFAVGPDFFDLYRIRLLRGRSFVPTDGESTVIVSETFARALWGDVDPIGRSFRRGKQSYTVVGVANEIRYPSLDRTYDFPEFYRFTQPTGGYLRVSFRCQGRCPDLPLLRQTLAALPAVRDIHTLGAAENAYLEELARPKAAAVLATLFTGIALVAAGGGLFGVLSYAVGRRRREFGIRASLGARPIELTRLVLGEGVRLAVAGVVLGSVAAWALARTLRAVVYDVSIGEPLIWSSVAAIVALTTLAACWSPARRAARVDPVELLREA